MRKLLFAIPLLFTSMHLFSQISTKKDSAFGRILFDTIKLAENDYKVAFEDKYSLDIVLINQRKSIELSFKKDPVICLSRKEKTYIAKGILVTTSAVPDCDLFFTVDKAGLIIKYKENTIDFHKTGYMSLLE